MLVYNEPEEMIPVYADPDRLRQVFINILDNAIKYSPPAGASQSSSGRASTKPLSN